MANPKSSHNNYFRVQGSLEMFTFDESSPESVDEALRAASELAARYRTPRYMPAVLVWRRTPLPQARSLPLIGEPLSHDLN